MALSTVKMLKNVPAVDEEKNQIHPKMLVEGETVTVGEQLLKRLIAEGAVEILDDEADSGSQGGADPEGFNVAKAKKDELMAYAKENEIDIKGLKLVDDIRAAVEKAIAGTGEDETPQEVHFALLSDDELIAIADEREVAIDGMDRQAVIAALTEDAAEKEKAAE